MFFIRCGGLIAWGLVVWGTLRTALGLFMGLSTGEINLPPVAVRYFGTDISDDSITHGMMIFVAGIVIGLLVQIAKGVKFE